MLLHAMARVLLEPVRARQTNFRLQGLGTDSRGIALGREFLVVLDSFERVVSFLGAYSDHASLDALMSSLTIERCRRQGGGRGYLLRCAARESQEGDRMSKLVAVLSGRVLTGSGSVFVQWRNHKAPFGYDLAVALSDLGSLSTNDVVVVEPNTQTRYLDPEPIDPTDLILRIKLRRVPLVQGRISADPDRAGVREQALVLVAPGLSDRVVSYLWRRELPMRGAAIRLQDDERPSLLLRLNQPSPEILDVLAPIPGVEIFRLVSPRAAVQVGWEHPINLASATQSLPANDLCLWRGQAGRLERLDGAPSWVEGRHLVQAQAEFQTQAPGDVALEGLESLKLEVGLRPSLRPHEARGCLVAWEELGQLRRALYVLPPSVLAAARLVALDEGLLVFSGGLAGNNRAAGAPGHRSEVSVASFLPLGQRLCEVAPGVLVPDGQELRPRLRPSLVREVLGLDEDDYAVFLDHDSPPLRVRAEQVSALDVSVVGRLTSRLPSLRAFEQPALTAPKLENAKLGRFALWGIRGGRS